MFSKISTEFTSSHVLNQPTNNHPVTNITLFKDQSFRVSWFLPVPGTTTRGRCWCLRLTQGRNTTWQANSSLPVFCAILTSVSHSHILTSVKADLLGIKSSPHQPGRCVWGGLSVVLHEERAVVARQPDRRDDGCAADCVSRGIAGGLRCRLRKQRGLSHLHRRNTL